MASLELCRGLCRLQQKVPESGPSTPMSDPVSASQQQKTQRQIRAVLHLAASKAAPPNVPRMSTSVVAAGSAPQPAATRPPLPQAPAPKSILTADAGVKPLSDSELRFSVSDIPLVCELVGLQRVACSLPGAAKRSNSEDEGMYLFEQVAFPSRYPCAQLLDLGSAGIDSSKSSSSCVPVLLT